MAAFGHYVSHCCHWVAAGAQLSQFWLSYYGFACMDECMECMAWLVNTVHWHWVLASTWVSVHGTRVLLSDSELLNYKSIMWQHSSVYSKVCAPILLYIHIHCSLYYITVRMCSHTNTACICTQYLHIVTLKPFTKYWWEIMLNIFCLIPRLSTC